MKLEISKCNDYFTGVFSSDTNKYTILLSHNDVADSLKKDIANITVADHSLIELFEDLYDEHKKLFSFTDKYLAKRYQRPALNNGRPVEYWSLNHI